VTTSGAPVQRPAATAAGRVFGAGIGLGALGLACSAFVLVRLVESWRITGGSISHHITIFGQRLSYPTANVDAIVILALALLGLIATLRAARRGIREAVADTRLRRRLEQGCRGEVSDALLLEDERPLAFCAGLLQPRIYVSTGALAVLDERALTAVLDHERHHARRRDPLRLAASRVLAESLFFVPGLRELTRRQQALAELSADEGAVHAARGNRSALARAMLSFSEASSETHRVGFEPARVDYLLGEPPTWRFPVLLCLAAGAVILLLLAVAFLAGQVAIGSATLAPPFLSRQPCVMALALVFALLALFAANCTRRVRAARGS
jgi:Zn-dependent protease with chaperone function